MAADTRVYKWSDAAGLKDAGSLERYYKMSSSVASKLAAGTRHKKPSDAVTSSSDHSPSTNLHNAILDLQSSAGNQAVNTLLNSLGGGAPLPMEMRGEMEHRFGEDFSNVRVHTNAHAARSASELNAKAYTLGNNIVFNEGRFSLETTEGRRLLAHELAHVVQQSRGGATPTLDPHAPHENAAETAATLAVAGNGPVTVGGATNVGVARLEQSEPAAKGAVSSTEVVELNATIGGVYIPAARVDIAYDILAGYKNLINTRLVTVNAFVEEQEQLRKEFPVIHRLSNLFTENISSTTEAASLLARGDSLLRKAQYRQVVDILAHAENQVDQLVRSMKGYQERQDLTTEGFITGLQGLKFAGGVAVGVLTAGSGTLAAAGAGAAYAAVQEASEQASKLHLGMIREIDWEGILVDAVINLGISALTLGLSRFSRGKDFAKQLGGVGLLSFAKIPEQELKQFAIATIRQLFARQTIKEMIIAKGTAILQTVIKSSYENVRGRTNGESVAATVKKRLQSMFFDESGDIAWQQIFYQSLSDAIGSATNRAAIPGPKGTTPAGQGEVSPSEKVISEGQKHVSSEEVTANTSVSEKTGEQEPVAGNAAVEPEINASEVASVNLDSTPALEASSLQTSTESSLPSKPAFSTEATPTQEVTHNPTQETKIKGHAKPQTVSETIQSKTKSKSVAKPNTKSKAKTKRKAKAKTETLQSGEPVFFEMDSSTRAELIDMWRQEAGKTQDLTKANEYLANAKRLEIKERPRDIAPGKGGKQTEGEMAFLYSAIGNVEPQIGRISGRRVSQVMDPSDQIMKWPKGAGVSDFEASGNLSAETKNIDLTKKGNRSGQAKQITKQIEQRGRGLGVGRKRGSPTLPYDMHNQTLILDARGQSITKAELIERARYFALKSGLPIENIQIVIYADD